MTVEIRPNLRPVFVDLDGQLYDSGTGETIVVPGLEPEAVREGLADAAAGRTRSLAEIRAGVISLLSP